MPCAYCRRTTCLEARTAVDLFLPDYTTWDDVIDWLLDPRNVSLSERAKTPEARALVSASARLGRTLGQAVKLLNPDVIVIGGPLSHVLDERGADENALAGLAAGTEPDLITELVKVATDDAMDTLGPRDDHNQRSRLAVFPSALRWYGVALGAATRVLDFDTELVEFFRRAMTDDRPVAAP